MNKNFLKITWRNIIKSKLSSAINILGLAVGMAAAILVGLWMYDELTFNRYHKHYEQIAQVMQNNTVNGTVETGNSLPIPLGEELRTTYGNYFTHVVTGTNTRPMLLQADDKVFTKAGNYFEPAIINMLSLRMIKGSGDALKDPSGIVLSESVAKSFFGDVNPIDKVMKLDGKQVVKVTGVYEDLPLSSEFHEMSFIASWDQYMNSNEKHHKDDWDYNSFRIYVQLADNANIEQISDKIKNAKYDKVNAAIRKFKPVVFLHPMEKWHLYSEFKNGIAEDGRRRLMWLFGIIGAFVLLMACMNYMNLATARSEKRAKEVGVRKAIGSTRGQLISQFYSESLMVVFIAFLFSILFVHLCLPFFNKVAEKNMTILWTSPLFWILCLGFTFVTGLIASSYPALYLSAFQPVKVLKGTFKAGRFAAVPRKVLVVVQFTISIALIIGIMIVFRQLQHARNRPIGYNPEGLVIIRTPTSDVHTHFAAIKDELKKSGSIIDMAESHSPVTDIFLKVGGFEWRGKDPNLEASFNTIKVSHDYGRTINWKIKEGRDFMQDVQSDSLGIVLNESAVKFMGLQNPVGEIIRQQDVLKGEPYTVIGVINDMLMESPYNDIVPTVYVINRRKGNFAVARLNPQKKTEAVLANIGTVLKRYNPEFAFDYQFVSEEHAHKFGNEERIEKLAGFFTALAILISCLGIFGLSSFVAEQRIKEIGVRKLLGASVFNLWVLLSKDFIVLVTISMLIAIPVAYYFMSDWLLNYEYRYKITWLIFAGASAATILITLLTVSYHTIRAASVNPVTSLRVD